MISALQEEGVAACGKHFPGHGDTQTDSHVELPLVEHPIDRLRGVELVPFRAAIDADVATMMTAHVFMPALDEQRPATLSSRVVTDLLRDELGFDGVILSDDLEMKAIASAYAVPQAAVLAIAAGCDGVLICSGDHTTQAAALEELIHALERDEVKRARVEDALARHRRAKQRFLTAPATPRPRMAARCDSVWVATNIAPSPTRWRGFCDAEASRSGRGEPHRRPRPSQFVPASRVR